jgi:SAM-dependent methyltransferase
MKKLVRALLPLSVRVWIYRRREYFKYRYRVIKGADPLIPPSILHNVGAGNFIAVGDEFFNYFVNIAGLKPNAKILDVGSGTGRMARPLTKYLTVGTYDGIDIVEQSIKWCQKTYTPRYPNFNFHHSNIYNKFYNPAGKVQSSEYVFPFEDNSFDFIFLTSVFTHMLPRDMDNYLAEVSRVLKQGGNCLITYFLLNQESLEMIKNNKSLVPFEYKLEE